MADERKYVGQHSCAELDAAVDQAALVPSLQTAVEGKQDELTTAQLAAVNSGATAEKIAAIANKQDELTTAQLAAANSGIDSSKVADITASKTAVASLASSAKNVARWACTEAQTTAKVTFTPQSDGSVLVESAEAASARATFALKLDVSDIESGNYILTGCPAGGKQGSSILYALYLMDVTANTRVAAGEDTGNGLPFTWAVDKTHEYAIMVDVRSGVTIGSKKFYPMITLQTIYAVSPGFEKYADAAKPKRTKTLTVAASGAQYTSLLRALLYCMETWDAETEFIIKIGEGTYDLSGVSARVTAGTLDEKGIFLMPNTKLIGAGSDKTHLTFIYDGTNDDIMTKVSALNAPYTCELSGFSLTVKNIRYAIHSDNALTAEASDLTNVKLKDTTITLEDVELVHQGFADGLTPSYQVPSCWGGGLWDGSVRVFKNCKMTSTAMTPWLTHDRVGLTKASRFVFEDCTFVNLESSVTLSENTAVSSLCFISWGSGIKHRVSIQRTMLNKYLTLRILTSMGNANAVNDYDISIGQSNTLVFEGAANSSRNNDSYRSNDCITSICQDSSVAAYTPVSSNRWYWIHAYNAAETIKGIALNAATTNGVVRVQVKGYIPLTLLTADTFTEGTLLGWNGTAYVEDTTHPLLKVIGGNVAQIVANGQ